MEGPDRETMLVTTLSLTLFCHATNGNWRCLQQRGDVIGLASCIWHERRMPRPRAPAERSGESLQEAGLSFSIFSSSQNSRSARDLFFAIDLIEGRGVYEYGYSVLCQKRRPSFLRAIPAWRHRGSSEPEPRTPLHTRLGAMAQHSGIAHRPGPAEPEVTPLKGGP